MGEQLQLDEWRTRVKWRRLIDGDWLLCDERFEAAFEEAATCFECCFFQVFVERNFEGVNVDS